MSEKKQNKKMPNLHKVLEDWQEQDSLDPQQLRFVVDEMDSIAQSAIAADQHELANLARTFYGLITIADCCDPEGQESCSGDDSQGEDNQSCHETAEILSFVKTHIRTLLSELDGQSDVDISEIVNEANSRWGDALELVVQSFPPIDGFCENEGPELVDATDTLEENSDSETNPTDQIDLLLSVLQSSQGPPYGPQGTDQATAEQDPQPVPSSPDEVDFSERDPSRTTAPEPPAKLCISDELASDGELRDAFLDDANRCLASMEQVVLDANAFPDMQQRVHVFCQQLHTLKGASASVGLGGMARYLHELEEWLQHGGQQNGNTIDDDWLLGAIDSVRKQMDAIKPSNSGTGENPSASGSPDQPVVGASQSAPSATPAFTSSSGEASVRVRASQLDKLMDMLAELVVIRNRRETRIDQLTQVTKEIGRCFTRLRRFNDQQIDFAKTRLAANVPGSSLSPSLAMGLEPTSVNAISEVASDLAEMSRSLTDVYKPVAEENLALSHFIRQFRQELMQLRRLPVAGLFQRLNRSARDAARTENKLVVMELKGEDTGLEQSVQEKLYEPLLHMVRNAVSHGIEDAESRERAGKDKIGKVTLRASATASLLVITVTDDGRGLDYEALRRRGFERGLLSTNRMPSKNELAKLIFHPGFSTRDEASEVSGRGIGMDVVATTIDRMQGRIEVDSETGHGTSVRILIPLTTGIEHAMVFRAAGRLFALPMRSISRAAEQQDESSNRQFVRFAEFMRLANQNNLRQQQTLVLDDQLGLSVDEVLGPDEVVVRALPAALQRHPLFSGVVLSGGGETVLLLNADRLMEHCRAWIDSGGSHLSETATSGAAVPNSQSKLSVLVVDDSLSARKNLAKRLRSRGIDVTEANDGLDALGHLQSDHFAAVFTDLDMPRMGGLELLSEISQTDSIEAEIVVVSSRCRDDVWQRVSENGAKAYLTKPVSEDSLAEALDQLNLMRIQK